MTLGTWLTRLSNRGITFNLKFTAKSILNHRILDTYTPIPDTLQDYHQVCRDCTKNSENCLLDLANTIDNQNLEFSLNEVYSIFVSTVFAQI